MAAQNQIQAKELSKKEIQALKKEKAFEKQKIHYLREDWMLGELMKIVRI